MIVVIRRFNDVNDVDVDVDVDDENDSDNVGTKSEGNSSTIIDDVEENICYLYSLESIY
ncbi:MAG: hypothetical protein ACI90V_012569 [Bacillariaceae sp.]